MRKNTVIAVGCALAAALVGALGCSGDTPVPEGLRRSTRAGLEGAFAGRAAELREALLLRAPLERAERVAALLRGLSPDALPEARRGFDSVVSDAGGFEVQLFAEWWARFDPAAALRWTAGAYVADRPAVHLALLREWAKRAPAEALENMPATRNRDLALDYRDAVLAGWRESGAPGLTEFVEGLDPDERARAARAMAGEPRDVDAEWIRVDPETGDPLPAPPPAAPDPAIAAALGVSDALERAERVATALRGLPIEALPSVRAAYDAVRLDPTSVEMLLLVEWWAAADPANAFDWAKQSYTDKRPAVAMAVLRAWAERDPVAAIREFGKARETAIQYLYLGAALEGWEESGRPGLEQAVLSLGSGEGRQRALMVLARRNVQRNGARSAFAWAEDLDDDDAKFKLNAYRKVAGAVAQVAPEVAAAWASEQMDGPYADGLAMFVGRAWAKQDGRRAMEWLKTLPPGRSRDRGVDEAFRVWRRQDFQVATAWLLAQPPAPWLDPATALFALTLATRDEPLEGIERARSIGDEEFRNATIARVARVWMERDADAARAWLETSDLPEVYKRKIPASLKHKRSRAQGRARRAPAPQADAS